MKIKWRVELTVFFFVFSNAAAGRFTKESVTTGLARIHQENLRHAATKEEQALMKFVCCKRRRRHQSLQDRTPDAAYGATLPKRQAAV